MICLKVDGALLQNLGCVQLQCAAMHYIYITIYIYTIIYYIGCVQLQYAAMHGTVLAPSASASVPPSASAMHGTVLAWYRACMGQCFPPRGERHHHAQSHGSLLLGAEWCYQYLHRSSSFLGGAIDTCIVFLPSFSFSWLAPQAA